MKLKLFAFFAMMMVAFSLSAKKYPVIKFEETTHDFGNFCMDDPVQKCTFKFTNTGKAKLILTMVHASCGCTVADYPKEPIEPGGTGVITVTYDATGKLPGPFKKNIQVFSNAKSDVVRLFIKGDMTDVPVSKKTEK